MWTRANVPGFSSASAFGTSASNGNARVAVLTAGLMRDTLPVNVRVRIGVDVQLHRLADLDPRRHLLGNLGGHLQRIDADDRHHRHLRLDELAEVDQPLLDVAVERRADARCRAAGGRPASCVASDAWMLGAQVLGVLQRRVVARLLRLQRRLARRRASAARSSVRLNSSLARSYACFACARSALAFCTSGVFSIGRQVLRVGRAVLRERARQRRLLLLEVVLLLLAIELRSATWPALTRSPRSARMRLTLPSASDEIVT